MKIPHKCGKKILRKMVKSKENQESRKIISTIQETKENRCKTQKDEDWFEPRRKCSSRGQELSKTRNGRGQKPLCRQVKIQAWTKVPCLEMKIQAWTGPTKAPRRWARKEKKRPKQGARHREPKTYKVNSILVCAYEQQFESIGRHLHQDASKAQLECSEPQNKYSQLGSADAKKSRKGPTRNNGHIFSQPERSSCL